MKDFNVKVASETENKEAQELFFKLGASWCYGKHINENIPSDCAIVLHNFGSQLFWAHTDETENYSESEEITIQELRDMVNQDQDEPFLTPETTLNDQYAEIEQVRKQTIDATLAERQKQYGCFEDVAHVTQGMIALMRQCGYDRMPAPHQMALSMIASKMARLVNGDFNHKDGWHDIGGYAKLIENLIGDEKEMPF